MLLMILRAYIAFRTAFVLNAFIKYIEQFILKLLFNLSEYEH